jgi:hypothetical protein
MWLLIFVVTMIQSPGVAPLLGVAHDLLPIAAYFGMLMFAAPVAYDELFVLATPAASGYTKQSLGSFIFLTFFTGWLFPIAWVVRTRGELMKNGHGDLPPAWHMIVPILQIVFWWKMANALEAATKVNKILIFLFSGIGMLLVQVKFNEMAGGAAAPPAGYPPQGGGYPPQPGGYPGQPGQPWQ